MEVINSVIFSSTGMFLIALWIISAVTGIAITVWFFSYCVELGMRRFFRKQIIENHYNLAKCLAKVKKIQETMD